LDWQEPQLSNDCLLLVYMELSLDDTKHTCCVKLFKPLKCTYLLSYHAQHPACKKSCSNNSSQLTWGAQPNPTRSNS